MRAVVNGEDRQFEEPLTVGALLDRLGAPQSGVAVAKNDSVVARSRHDSELVEDGDRIEIIRAVAGG